MTSASLSMPEETGTPPDPDPDPGEGAGPVQGARLLYGATLAGGFQPVPVVTLGGVDIASGLLGGQLPPGGLMVVDGVASTWGRDNIYDQPDPASGQLVLFDPSGTWAAQADRRGQALTLSWSGNVPGTGPTRSVYFRGRVGSPIRFRPKTVVIDGQAIHGALVFIPLVSVLVDYANRAVVAAWPEEGVGARRARLQALWGSSATITTRAYWDQSNIAPVAIDDQVSLYQSVVDLFDSTGADRLTFLPASSSLTYVQRRDYTGARGHGILWWDAVGSGTARAGKGVYIRGIGNTALYGYLDGGQLEVEDQGELRQREKITRVVLQHPNGGVAGYPRRTVTKLVSGTSEGVDAFRELRHESMLTFQNFADTSADDLAILVAREGSSWQLGGLHWSTRRSGGFDSAAQAAAMLTGGETQDILFLQRSQLPRIGVTPAYGVMGQTITYRDGGWELDFQLSPLAVGPLHHAITWEEIDDGSATYQVEWWDDDNPRGMHESLTYEDLGHVHRGMVPSSYVTGPSTGWDFIPR